MPRKTGTANLFRAANALLIVSRPLLTLVVNLMQVMNTNDILLRFSRCFQRFCGPFRPIPRLTFPEALLTILEDTILAKKKK
jgi:hypothetical protein